MTLSVELCSVSWEKCQKGMKRIHLFIVTLDFIRVQHLEFAVKKRKGKNHMKTVTQHTLNTAIVFQVKSFLHLVGMVVV